MEIKHYQDCLNIFNKYCELQDNSLYQLQHIKTGLTNEELFEKYSVNGVDVFNPLNEVRFLLDRTKDFHIFCVEKNIKPLLQQTKSKMVINNLPFNNIYIDTKIPIYNNNNEYFVYGIFLSNYERHKEIYDIIYTITDVKTGKVVIHGIRIKNGIINPVLMDKDNFGIFVPKSTIKVKEIFNPVLLFCSNFLDFLNTPEIEIITNTWTQEQNLKRLNRGKVALPTVHSVRVTGKLKKYIDTLESGGHFKLSHRFWVRGHFRELRSDRYKEHKKQWICPYIKGNGILINKEYEVENTRKTKQLGEEK